MTNEKLYEAIGDISDRKVNEAKQVRKAKQANWAKWGAMAACLCVIAGLSIKAGLTSAPNDKVNIDFTNVEDYTTDENTTLCETPNWGISLSVKNVTSTGLTLIVKQSGGKATGLLKTGESYRLVAFVGETWKDAEVILDSYGWNSIAHNITVDGSTEFEIDWKWLYGELPSGKYRLVKEFMHLRKAGDYDTADFIVEFTIE